MTTSVNPPSVSSTGTTVSAKLGSGAPVMIRTHSPGPASGSSGLPAGTSAITRKRVGAVATSAKRTA